MVLEDVVVVKSDLAIACQAIGDSSTCSGKFRSAAGILMARILIIELLLLGFRVVNVTESGVLCAIGIPAANGSWVFECHVVHFDGILWWEEFVVWDGCDTVR